LNNIIALTIQMQNQVVQSFLNMKIGVLKKAKFKSCLSLIIKGKKDILKSIS